MDLDEFDYFFETLPREDAGECSGTSLRGQWYTTYDRLVEVFGEPTLGPNDDGDKVSCLWVIEFYDGEIATIYDWKTYETPVMPYSWHIGGHHPGVEQRIIRLLQD